MLPSRGTLVNTSSSVSTPSSSTSSFSLYLPSKHNQPSTSSPRTTAANRRRLGTLFASFGIPGSPLRRTVASSSGPISRSHVECSPSPGSTLRMNGKWEKENPASPTKSGQRDEEIGGVRTFAERMAELALGSSPTDERTGSASVSGCGNKDKGKGRADDWDRDEGRYVDDQSATPLKKEMDGSCKLLDLPDEILLLILLHLPPTIAQMHKLSRISTHFHDLAQAPILWARVFDATPGYRLSAEAKEWAVAVLQAPRGRWDGICWIADSTSGESGGSGLGHMREGHASSWSNDNMDGDHDHDEDEAGETIRPNEIPIHYPTLYRSRRALAKQIRSTSPSHSPRKSTLTGHTDAVYCLHLVGRWLITGSRDRGLRIWKLPLCAASSESTEVDGRTVLVKSIDDAHDGSVLGLKYDLDDRGRGRLISGSSDCTAKIWDLNFGTDSTSIVPTSSAAEPESTYRITVDHLATFRDHTASVLDVDMTSKHFITCSKDATVRVYDRGSLACLHILTGHTMPVNCLAVAPDRAQMQVISASGDGKWIIWDLVDGTEVRRGGTSRRGLACIAWEGDYIVTGDNDHAIWLYNTATGQPIRKFDGHTGLVRTVALQPDAGLIISGSYDKCVRVWDMHTGKLIKSLDEFHQSLVFDVQISVNRLISASHDDSGQILTWGNELPYIDLFA
ncbi:hypothetical protein IAR55_003059 [Kwoniella newhampshirensis]|uniref:F-box domain-containing protein n=1 Tax=Kwoniella newhampshirensis TaxID=1651941 RepID=A0AAW0Z0A2_9TREE